MALVMRSFKSLWCRRSSCASRATFSPNARPQRQTHRRQPHRTLRGDASQRKALVEPTGVATNPNDGVKIAYYVTAPPETETHDTKRPGETTPPPLVLVNGWAGAARDWGGLVKLFARSGRTIVTWDHRGVGRSDAPDAPETYSISAMAADLIAVLNDAGVTTTTTTACDVVGFSMGGLVTQSAAMTEPDKFRKLVLASTTPGGAHTVDLVSSDFFDLLDTFEDPVDDVAQKADDDRKRREAARRRAAAAFFVAGLPQTWVADRVDAMQKMVTQFVDSNFVARPARGVRGQKRAATRFAAAYDAASGRTIPHRTLVLHGDVDPVLHPECASLLLHAIPRATILLLAGVGHHAYIQEPLEWAHAILRFLDESDDDDEDRRRRRGHTSLLRFDRRDP